MIAQFAQCECDQTSFTSCVAVDTTVRAELQEKAD